MRAAGLEPVPYETPERLMAEIDDREQHACILPDITIPRLSGLEVRACLKERGIQLPLIAVSAPDDETRSLAREIGMQYLLRKPVDDRALLDAIEWVSAASPRRDKEHTGK